MSLFTAHSIHPTVFFLLLLDFVYGGLLIGEVGRANIVGELANPSLIGLGMLGIGMARLIGMAWKWPILILLTSGVAGWLWAMLAVTSLIRVSSTGGIASFTVFTAMSAWVFARVLIDVIRRRRMA